MSRWAGTLRGSPRAFGSPESVGLRQRPEAKQRLGLDLSDAVARKFQQSRDIRDAALLVPEQAVAKLEHASLARRQVLERLTKMLVVERLDHQDVWDAMKPTVEFLTHANPDALCSGFLERATEHSQIARFTGTDPRRCAWASSG